jgi:hypothetical protein
MWTTVERDLRKRRVWVGSSPVFGMTSMIPMSGNVRIPRVMVASVWGILVDAPDAGGRKGG